MKQSDAWKTLERSAAKVLGGFRVTRGADFGISDVDVIVPDFPSLRVDCKRRKQPFAHHRLLSEVKQKYCFKSTDIPLLVTKNHNQRGAVVAIELNDFGRLLNLLRTNNIRLQKVGQCSDG